MVASSQPLASQAGLSVLMEGGNAADAAIAAAAALNVTEPASTGIGGDCFALYFDATTQAVTALNGSGRAAAGLTIDVVEQAGMRGEDDSIADSHHPFCTTVPGACAGWFDLLERHGSMPMSKVLEPAARLAEEGFPVAPVAAHFWQHGEKLLRERGPELLIDGKAPRAGEIFRNPGLARTFRTVGEGGREAFYGGDLTRRIVESMEALGGVMTEADLGNHCSTWETPICTDYRAVRVWECPPNGQGLTALVALNLLKGWELRDLEPLGPARLHRLIEALRLAFADSRTYVADPAHNPAPLEALLSDGYAEKRRKLISLDRATTDSVAGSPLASSDTVYFCVVDGQGNACSFINSNYMGFGTGIVPEGTGFALQNRGHNFTLERGHANALAPGKRPYHTIMPGMLTREDGTLLGPFGVMGGFMQPQGHVQVVTALVDDGLDPQRALERRRVSLLPARPSGRVALEDGISGETAAGLAALGHDVYTVGGWDRAIFGRGQVILRQPDGVLVGGSDLRADGCAVGF
jgi:gamma-glutamyltranspeptidase/glutathione hydrolase